jgi:hypothetical protein
MRHRRIIPSLPPVRVWAAEITVDEPLARRLIGSQFPEVEAFAGLDRAVPDELADAELVE